ncbi:hypothetical protein SARC_02808 [Sphaeroforma arctica JP610]|uniref:Uncharacterized protein n=1 Tax=Sphaeroforma arctica JP610 TaxID=667725 RepID=A0A0L0G9P7_9EUKA|nr:hypothetical protein SARC_02808 [Sphaeroforma arctica JP610]KNC84988.1 hypothetical protein SARC_02808 [Sphaeroforma arctica JP610]|eukprot:XP_014158890.1 hypothetical protein SARC_02808 [Sphaeroforma arctica JP610]
MIETYKQTIEQFKPFSRLTPDMWGYATFQQTFEAIIATHKKAYPEERVMRLLGPSILRQFRTEVFQTSWAQVCVYSDAQQPLGMRLDPKQVIKQPLVQRNIITNATHERSAKKQQNAVENAVAQVVPNAIVTWSPDEQWGLRSELLCREM